MGRRGSCGYCGEVRTIWTVRLRGLGVLGIEERNIEIFLVRSLMLIADLQRTLLIDLSDGQFS